MSEILWIFLSISLLNPLSVSGDETSTSLGGKSLSSLKKAFSSSGDKTLSSSQAKVLLKNAQDKSLSSSGSETSNLESLERIQKALTSSGDHGSQTCPPGPEEVSLTDFYTPPILECPEEHRGSCCTKKTFTVPSLECQYPWRVWNRQACLGGFYKKTNYSSRACPPGYYCPENRICLVPCQSGAYCPQSQLVPFMDTLNQIKFVNPVCAMLDMCCLPYNRAPVKRRDWYVCGGTAVADACPPGYFCPNTTTKIICPSGHFCAQGSIKPRKCPIFTYCADGQSSPIYSAFGVIFDIILLVCVVIFILLKRSSDKLKYWMPWNWKKTASMEYSLENPDEERYEPKHNPFTIRFFNISCTLKDKTKRVLLDQISGEIRPFCMTAVVGPSGCGKTTLINTLCGKAYYADVEGHILINGKDEPVWKYKNTIGFVSQEDTMHRELTVREVLMYQAQLRLPSHLSKRQKNARVNRAIRMLKLTDVADAPIGDQETSRGISGGERKRVSIGMELVADTQVLILDEPTSGLDSSSSLTIARILKSIAERGITVCVILHQPRYEIFEMFDHILLLGSGGRLIYQGSPTAAADYFKHIGFPPPVYRNPADFYIDVISGDVVKESWDPSTLPELWEEYRQQQVVISNDDHDVNDWEISFSSNENTSAHASSKFELPPLNDDTFRLEGASQRELDKLINFCYSIPSSTAECLRQFWIFLSRTALCQTRIWSTLLLDQFTILVTGFVVGFLFCEVPIVKYLAFVTTSGLSIGLLVLVSSLRCFGHQRLIYWRESSVGVNKLSFFLAVNIAQFPILIISPLTYWSSCYTLAAPRSSFNSYYIVFLAVVFAISGSGYLMSIIFNPRNSQIVSIVLLLIATMCSGSQKRLCYMDGFPVLGPLSYKASFSKYMCQALYETEVTEFPDVLRGVPEYIAQQNHYTLVDEFWWCTGIIVLMGVIARVLAFVALVFTNRGKQV